MESSAQTGTPEEDVDEEEASHGGGRVKEPPWSPTAIDKDFFFDDEEDPVFKTVPGWLNLNYKEL